MELHVTGTEGIPEGSVLSILAGSSRRQAPASEERPFHFPLGVDEASSLRVDVLEPLASAKFILRPGDERHPDCQFAIPLHAAGGGVAPAAGTRADMGLTFALSPNLAEEAHAHAAAREGPNKDGESKLGMSKPLRAQELAEYLDRHNLVEFTQQLVQAVIREKPDRPYAFIASQLSFPEQVPKCRGSPPP